MNGLCFHVIHTSYLVYIGFLAAESQINLWSFPMIDFIAFKKAKKKINCIQSSQIAERHLLRQLNHILIANGLNLQ